jgi:uncharacterized OB-fold protein
MKTLRYPKTYGIITEYFVVLLQTAYPYKHKQFTWDYYFKNTHTLHKRFAPLRRYVIIRVKLDNGQSVDIDALGYTGKQFERVVVGKRVKIYSRPQDRRRFVYKLVGE